MYEHLVFFDSECPFCHRSVKHLIDIDVNQRLGFAPLNGETASEILAGPQFKLRGVNSLILVENYQSTERKFWIRSKALLRIYWLIGNLWRILGIFSFLPSFLGDFFYRQFANHRHQFKLKMPQEPGPKERFLP